MAGRERCSPRNLTLGPTQDVSRRLPHRRSHPIPCCACRDGNCCWSAAERSISCGSPVPPVRAAAAFSELHAGGGVPPVHRDRARSPAGSSAPPREVSLQQSEMGVPLGLDTKIPPRIPAILTVKDSRWRFPISSSSARRRPARPLCTSRWPSIRIFSCPTQRNRSSSCVTGADPTLRSRGVRVTRTAPRNGCGSAAYEGLFADAPAGALRGESTPFYLWDTASHRADSRADPGREDDRGDPGPDRPGLFQLGSSVVRRTGTGERFPHGLCAGAGPDRRRVTRRSGVTWRPDCTASNWSTCTGFSRRNRCSCCGTGS